MNKPRDKGKTRGFYKPFMKARLSDEMQEWLAYEKEKFKSWQKFFEELKKTYARTRYFEVPEERREEVGWE